MFSPAFVARVGVGLAATAVEQAAALPVRLTGEAVQTYLHMGQRITELAVKGDAVLASVAPRRSEQPEWATFDEDEMDEDLDPVVYGAVHTADDDVPSGPVRGRRR